MTDETFSLLELFPSAYPGHRLHERNHFSSFWPFVSSSGMDAPLRCKPGFKLVGWSHPPYAGGAAQVMVVECLEPVMMSHDPTIVDVEPGIYWYHWGNDHKQFAKPV